MLSLCPWLTQLPSILDIASSLLFQPTWTAHAHFNCPIYISADDQEWLCRTDDFRPPARSFIISTTKEILPLSRQSKLVGISQDPWCFIGRMGCLSLILRSLYRYEDYSFMWSIPLPPSEIERIWKGSSHLNGRRHTERFMGLTLGEKGRM